MHRQYRLTPVQKHTQVRTFPCLECRTLFGEPALQFLAGSHAEDVSKNVYDINNFDYISVCRAANSLASLPRGTISRIAIWIAVRIRGQD